MAKEFKVSRPLIREVLTELKTEGLVEKIPNKGAIVRKLDTSSLFEVMETREVLEGLAVRLAAGRTSRKDWKDLEEEFGQPFEMIVKNLEFDKYLDLLTKFRYRMLEAAGNEELNKMIGSLYSKTKIVQRKIAILPGRIQEALEEHREVLSTIMEGNAKKAEEKKRLNMHNARECLKKYEKWAL